MEKNYFVDLNSINVGDKVESKNGLTYLSWAWAWGEAKKYDPEANYEIFERQTEFGPVNYFTDGRTCWVKTAVTIKGVTHIEELPIMNNTNKSIMLDAVTSVDVNKTIQRSLTKAVARHGLGLYIYAGEDLPEAAGEAPKADPKKVAAEKKVIKGTATPVEKPATATVEAVAPVVETESEELETLKKEIGRYAKKVKTVYGSLEPYAAIVKAVTKVDNFRCNTAEEKHIPLLKEILNQLKNDPKLQ